MKDIKLKRIYDEPSDDDGYRILVDRLWPRGISKKDANLDEWEKRSCSIKRTKNMVWP